jgi:branched-chain amino acid transport system permease protein
MKRQLAWLLALLVACIALTLLSAQQRFVAYVVSTCFIQLLWASGMNILSGYVGLTPLTFAGVAGISGYISVDLVLRAGWSFWLATPVGAVAAAAIGVLLGLPSLRLRGFYFVLSSLVIQTVLTLAFTAFPTYTNGDTGISQIPPPAIPFLPASLQGQAFDLVIAVAAWLGVAVAWAIARSGFGRRLVAIREDADLAETMGIGVVHCKLAAFFVASLYAGVGGSFMAFYVGFISPRSFDLLSSLNTWLIVAFGGQGTIVGPIIGTLILAPLPSLMLQYYSVKDIIYGLLIIAVTVLMPAGIYGAFLRRRWPRRAAALRRPPVARQPMAQGPDK